MSIQRWDQPDHGFGLEPLRTYCDGKYVTFDDCAAAIAAKDAEIAAKNDRIKFLEAQVEMRKDGDEIVKHLLAGLGVDYGTSDDYARAAKDRIDQQSAEIAALTKDRDEWQKLAEALRSDPSEAATKAAESALATAEAAQKALEDARSVPDRIDGQPGSIDANAWRKALNDAVLDALSATDGLVDTWAYGARAVGIFEAARELGLAELVAMNNPPAGPDERTTKFCHWVHGRTIELRGSWVKSLERYRAAVESDDAEAAKKARPMGSFSKTDGPQQFRAHFVRAGLPPYHWRCRTQAMPRELAEGTR